jgi:hypothetical protein
MISTRRRFLSFVRATGKFEKQCGTTGESARIAAVRCCATELAARHTNRFAVHPVAGFVTTTNANSLTAIARLGVDTQCEWPC